MSCHSIITIDEVDSWVIGFSIGCCIFYGKDFLIFVGFQISAPLLGFQDGYNLQGQRSSDIGPNRRLGPIASPFEPEYWPAQINSFSKI
jgi:hypothetical protein